MSDLTGGEGPSPADATAEERPSQETPAAAGASGGDGPLNSSESAADPIPEMEPSEVPETEPPVDDLAGAPETPAAEDRPSAPDPEATGAGSEQIEWQPVVDGDQIEWQPVVSSELTDTSGDEASAAFEPQPEFEYPEGTELEAPWEPDVAEATSPASGNGAVPGSETGSAIETPEPAEPARAAPASPRRSSGTRRPGGRPPGPPSARQKPFSDEPEGGQEEEDRRTAAGAAAKTKRQVVVLSILTLVVIVVAVLGFVLSRGAKDKGSQARTGSSLPSNTVPKLPESALQTYSDDATGFTVKFAKTWEILRAPNADVRLVVNAGGNDGFQVRVAPIQTVATVQNIENFKAVTDAIVFGDKTATSVKEQLITVNGLLAYYYLYTFHDPVSNSEGVHAQYFVFEGNRMFIMTFQTVPSDEFAKQATLWDQVAESFTVQPRPQATTTTAAPSTSTTVP